jgi:uncharacterized protein (TIGR03083 family)
MQPQDHADVLSRAGQRLADVADGNLGRPVPTCPDWTVADLTYHLGEVLSFWTQIGTGSASPDQITDPARPADPELVDWFRGRAEAAVTALGSQDPATERWNWTGVDQTAGWIQRRMAQEATIHAWDGLNAVGAAEPIEVGVAIDGIDEFLAVFVGALAPVLVGPVESVHVHVTDGDAAAGQLGEWLLTTGEGSSTVERAHVKGDVAVRGSASDLVLALWRRRDPDGLDVVGDRAVLDRLLASAKF